MSSNWYRSRKKRAREGVLSVFFSSSLFPRFGPFFRAFPETANKHCFRMTAKILTLFIVNKRTDT